MSNYTAPPCNFRYQEAIRKLNVKNKLEDLAPSVLIFFVHQDLSQGKKLFLQQQWQVHCVHQRCTPTLCIRVTDEVSASLGFEVRQNSIMVEIIEQGSVFPLWQQGDSDWWPQLPQLDAVGGIKVLQGQTGGRVLGRCGSLSKSSEVKTLILNVYLLWCSLSFQCEFINQTPTIRSRIWRDMGKLKGHFSVQFYIIKWKLNKKYL